MRLTPLAAAAAITFAVCGVRLYADNDAPAGPARTTLPITRVTLFTAGVGHFHREGTVDGPARVELTVAEEDVNDLIKTLIAADADSKTAAAVTFDARTPAEVTLKAFAVDLTENPTVGALLKQVRGEKVQVTNKAGETVAGSIVSVEVPDATETRTLTDAGWRAEDGNAALTRTVTLPARAAKTERVNLLTADGVEGVSLDTVKRIKFLNPELQAEFRRALEVLAGARKSATKTVGVTFPGGGKRNVRVGYVAEAPLWKPSYRVTLGADPKVQGWVAVENTTDEDWKDVKLALVSGRPMTFKMDLYDPLFVPRPTVEPELYASLRPPVYQQSLGQANFIGGFGGVGGLGNSVKPQGIQGGFAGGTAGQVGSVNNLGVGGGIAGVTGGSLGVTGGFVGMFGTAPPSLARPSVRSLMGTRQDYASFRDRTGDKDREKNTVTGTGPTASADFGRSFRYEVPTPVSLPRLQSALLPVLHEPAGAERVSIFNEQVLADHPLLGLKLTNRSKLFLAQGPVAVYDGDEYAGDARLPDVEPGETRLLSYAIDLDVDVKAEPTETVRTTTKVQVREAAVVETERVREGTVYRLRNRSAAPRTVSVTRPIRPDWELVAPAKPTERTRDLYRFEVKLAPGDAAELTVSEERTTVGRVALKEISPGGIERLSALAVTSPAVKAVFGRVTAERAKREEAEKAVADEQGRLKEITDNQARIRANIERVPKESQAFQRYLKKFDEQETEIETRQARVRELQAAMDKQKKELDEFLKTATAE